MLEGCIRSIIYIFIVTISGIDYIRKNIKPSLQLADANRSSSSDDDDFFSALQSSQAQDGAKQLDTWPVQQITWTCWNPFQRCASFTWSWTLLYLPQRPVKGSSASQDLSSVQEERDWILATLKTNFLWRWTDTFSVSVENFMQVERRAVCPYNTQGGWERVLVNIDDGRSLILDFEKFQASFSCAWILCFHWKEAIISVII